jgi:hypothetical protein
MGCDIHSFVEIMGENGVWREMTEPIFDNTEDGGCVKFSADPFCWRSYRMFGFLAGVRDHDINPISRPRGLPDDASNQHYCWDEDYRSISWLLASELLEWDYSKKISRFSDETYESYLGPGFLDRVAQIAGLHDDPRQVRVVMAFDN